MKLPGCSSTSPSGSSRLNETAFSGSEPSRPGVDVDVVLGEPRHAGDDALHLLVRGVRGPVGLLAGGEDLLDLGAVLLEQRLVVEVGRLGELVVALGLLLQDLGLLGELGAVLGQVVLDRPQLAAGVDGAGGVVSSSSSPQPATSSAATAAAVPKTGPSFIRSGPPDRHRKGSLILRRP